MRSGLIGTLGLTLLLAVSASPAQQAETEDAVPWHVAKVARLNRTRPQSDQPSPPADAQLKYLHIQLNFERKPEQARLHRFRIVTEHGDPVGRLWGFNDSASLLVFEGEWKSLAGLYLDGLGHREPLFAAPPAAKQAEASRETREVRESPASSERSARTETPPHIGVRASSARVPNASPRSATATSRSVGAGSGSGAGVSAGMGSGSGSGAGQGGGSGGGSGSGGGGGGGDLGGGLGGREATTGGRRVATRGIGPPVTSHLSTPLPLILYLSCGEDDDHGKIFQVDEEGHVLGIVTLPYLATGLALHGDNALIAVTPRDGGHIYRIDDTGRVSVVRERDKGVPYPIDVGVGADSDTIVVADNVAHALFATSTSGAKPESYLQFKRPRRDNEGMSVAVTKDKHVLFGGNNDPGIFRYSGDDGATLRPPLLRGAGGVAADTASLKWAATQEPNQICLFEGEQLLKRFLLLGNKRIYRQGLLSFAPAGALVVAARNADQAEGEPWFILYQTEDKKDLLGNDVRVLFKWDRARMVDFVVGPRMRWDRNSPSKYRTVY